MDDQMENGGWHCFNEKAFGRGTLDGGEGLSAYAALPRERWPPRFRRSVEAGAEFYLEGELLRQGRQGYVPWTRTHYPVHSYYDFLVGLDTRVRLGSGGDRRLRRRLALREEQGRPDGTWILDKVHPDLGVGPGQRLRGRPKRFALEEERNPSKWITPTALGVLKRVEESAAG